MKTRIITAVAAVGLTVFAIPPVNDNFESASVIAGASGTANGTTVGATRQVGEPQHFRADDGGNSIWYTWTAPADGDYGFDTRGSAMGNDIAIYRGSSLAGLQQLGAGGFESSIPSYVHLQAQKDSNYFVAVVGSDMSMSGVTKLNYYQDQLSGWIDVTVTSHAPVVAVASDGSMVWDDACVIIARQYRTNQYGLTAFLQATTNVQHLMSFADKKDAYWFQGVPLQDLPINAVPTDYKYKRLLVQRGRTNGFDVFNLTKTGFEKAGTLVLSNSTVEVPAARLTKKGVAIVTDGNDMGIAVYDKTMTKLLWSIPPVQDNLRPVKSREGGFFGLYTGAYEDMIWAEQTTATHQVLLLYKKGKIVTTQMVPLPAVGELEYVADAKGGVVYWTYTNHCQGPVTYLDKKGKVIVDQVALPGISPDWEPLAFDGKNLIVSLDEGDTNHLVSFSIGKTVAKQGERWIHAFNDFLLDGKAVYVMTREKAKNSVTYYGLQQFDATLMTVKWTEPPAAYAGMQYVGRGVWCKVHAVSTPPQLNLFIDVFNAKGPIITHIIHTVGE